MYWIRVTFFCLFTCLYFTVFSQPFPCNGRLILSAVTSTSNTSAYSVTFGGFGAVFYNQMALYQGESFDAVGFNPKDNYIYGVQASTNSVVRLRVDGTYEVIGSVAPSMASTIYAGDCSAEGLYLCYDSQAHKVLFYRVVDGFDLLEELNLFWDPSSDNSGPFTTRIDDFAIDPNNPNIAYTFQVNYAEADYEPAATRGYLLQININPTDPNAGMVTPVAPIDDEIILQMGSLFFTKEGQLFGLGPFTTGPIIANRLVSINPFTGMAAVQGLSPPQAAISDGCSCPYSLSFENVISPGDVDCSGTELNFVLTINNRSNEELSGVTLTDTLPEGMIVQAVTGDLTGDIAAGMGIGSQILTINNLSIPARAVAVITITAAVVDAPVGFLANQAHLTNLPLLFGGEIHSDFPVTTGFIGDETPFLVNPQLIDNVTVEITPPTDCLNANDAQIIVSSPELLAGQPYRIKLINQGWEESFYEVVINANNAFMIDSLEAGRYRLAEVKPENINCSFAWKEETIIIDPPNEQLQVTATTNSPICEGADLQFNGTISPAGEMSWRGPQAFLSFDLNPQINAVTSNYTGTYKMKATYGACEQVRELDVLITPEIQAAISGELLYCERENLQLEAEGMGRDLTFQWSGPAMLVDTLEQLNIPSIAPSQDGEYQLIIDNGYCQDTALATVVVRPSPTIVLPRIIETDFCEPVKLTPEITGDDNVTYSWIPMEGLSCYDCLTPELQPPFLSSYRLTVINDSLCTDTTQLAIALTLDKLLYIPNVFSPNKDGVNDRFQVFPGCGVYRIRSLEIVDRWGAIVYTEKDINSSDPQAFWDGVIGGKVAPTGVYIWQMEIELADGTTQLLSGDIGLLR